MVKFDDKLRDDELTDNLQILDKQGEEIEYLPKCVFCFNNLINIGDKQDCFNSLGHATFQK